MVFFRRSGASSSNWQRKELNLHARKKAPGPERNTRANRKSSRFAAIDCLQMTFVSNISPRHSLVPRLRWLSAFTSI
jgi:hypothetical protein